MELAVGLGLVALVLSGYASREELKKQTFRWRRFPSWHLCYGAVACRVGHLLPWLWWVFPEWGSASSLV